MLRNGDAHETGHVPGRDRARVAYLPRDPPAARERAPARGGRQRAPEPHQIGHLHPGGSLVFNLYSPVSNSYSVVIFNLYPLVFDSRSLVFNLYSLVFDLCSLVFNL